MVSRHITFSVCRPSLLVFFTGKTNAEDVSVFSLAIQLCVIKTCIVKYEMSCIGLVLSHHNSVTRREADISSQTGILNQDAVAMLGEFPKEVSSVSSECAPNALVLVTFFERSRKSFVDEATFIEFRFVEVVGNNAIVTIAIRKCIRHLAIQNCQIQ